MNDIKNNQEKFKIYYDFLMQENKKFNLTNIVEMDEVYHKHFIDSLMLQKTYDFSEPTTLCDVGSGAGFPSIPLKIVFPNIKLTIIEPTLKRCYFLKVLTELLQLENVKIIHDRAESAVTRREQFDVVCARAVAHLPVLLELCIPLVKENGYFLAMKGSNYQEEIDVSKNALECLDSVIEKIQTYSLDNNYGNHCIIVIKKNKITSSQYPRSFTTIKKKPL